MRELARQRTVEAIKTLTAVMRSGRTEQARVRAAEALLNRGWGQPTQSMEHSGHMGPAVDGPVLVIGGDEQSYIEGLRRAREMVGFRRDFHDVTGPPVTTERGR